MDKMVIKKYFQKDNFVFSDYNKKQKMQSLFVSFGIIIFFILSSFTFFNVIYVISNCAGSIVCSSIDVAFKDLFRSLPIIFSFLLCLFTLVLFQVSFRNYNLEYFLKSTFKYGLIISIIAVINILYILIMRITKNYLSLVEGSPSPIYPLDAFLFSFLFICIGVFAIIYSKKLHTKFPYLVTSRVSLITKNKVLYKIGMSLFLLVSLYGFSSGIFTLFIYDFTSIYAFYGFGLFFIYILSPILLGIWQFYYNELKEEKKREYLLYLSFLFGILSDIFIIIYFVSLATNLDAPSNAGFGMLPITFAASVNLATIVMVISPFIFSLIISTMEIIKKRKNERKNSEVKENN